MTTEHVIADIKMRARLARRLPPEFWLNCTCGERLSSTSYDGLARAFHSHNPSGKARNRATQGLL